LWRLLLDENVDVEKANGVAEAARKLKDIGFDCVIMDVDLPEMKGYDAVSVLQTIDPNTRIIMTAAQNTMELEAKVRKQNIFYYHIKSFDAEELKQAVRAALRKAGKSREARRMDSSVHILVVDDDQDYVKAITTILEGKGYQVDAAFNKDEAIEKIEAAKPDLILLDIMMERMSDGFTVCYKLKHDPELSGIPVLAISAITEETGLKFSPRTDGEYFEADDYMSKPVKAAELLERVEKLLEA